ncbi:MAG: ABC transporter ATP-binding protein [Chloroflexi bacterium]|nr:ABC transporter ATP-binding protein [Chloroflexota bacterium]
MSVPALQTRDLSIGYPRRRKGDICLARALNLRLEPGSLVGLLGPNGVGKSTLLRTLAAMRAPLAGQVLLDGEDARRMRPGDLAKTLSLVLTNTPHPDLMTGYELVALGRLPHSDWLGRLTGSDREIISWALDAVNAGELACQILTELSDGQRQKLMIARALAQETAIMLLDEPTAFLDLPRRVEVMRLLKRLAHQTGRAILVSTHDLDQALRNCDQLWLMREGAMLVGAPEDLVLDGGITETFHTDGISFDEGSSAFAVERSAGAAIHVKGSGARETWMRRALERNGYRYDPAAGVAAISLGQNGQGPEWHLTIEERLSRHHSVAEVLATLKDAGI